MATRRSYTPAPWEERDHRFMRATFTLLGLAMFLFAVLCALGVIAPLA